MKQRVREEKFSFFAADLFLWNGKFWLPFLSLILTTLGGFAQSNSQSEEQKEAYIKVITQRADKIVLALNIKDIKKKEKIRDMVRDQYKDLNEIYRTRDETIKSIKQAHADDKTAIEGAKNEELARTEIKIDELHKAYIAHLSSQLNPAQIEVIKNGMTYNVLPLTYRAYQEEILSLTEDQKKQILTWLTEAREHAIDAESAEKKHAWFGKYKGRINNYLSAAGYDLKKEGAEWEQRRKSADKIK